LASARSRHLIAAAVVVLGVAAAAARQGSSTRSALPFTVISQDGRRPLGASLVGDHVMVSLDDLAALFQLTVREDTLAGGVTIGYKGRSVILTPGQALASVGGRLVSLPVPVVRDGRRWLVPIEFVNRALGPIYDARLDVRKNSRLVVVGDVRVPRITVHEDVSPVQTRVAFDMAPRTPYTITPEPNRLLVRFDADALDVSLPPAAPQGLVQTLRLVESNRTIAIDLGPRYGSFRASLVPQEGNAGQLQLDLIPAAPEPPAGTPPPRPPTPSLPEAPPPGPGPSAGVVRTIVIDPGHGGEDAGVKGPSGTLEKDVTLALARRLKAAIESRLGVRVLLTRDGDAAVAPDERAGLANNEKADLFISVHANGAFRREVSGAQIYYLDPEQAAAEARGPAPGRQVLPTIGGGVRDLEMVPWEFAQVRRVGESARLAGAIQEQIRDRVRLNASPIQQAPLRVLAGANMPAVLVEAGFLTNPDDEQRLGSEAYVVTLTQALVDGLVRFLELPDRPRLAPNPAAVPPGRQP
jgi:N-acetylmuramoyl-L-alanine amidase